MSTSPSDSELILEVKQPLAKRSHTPKQEDLKYAPIPENLPTLSRLFDSGDYGWLVAKRLVTPETLMQLKDPPGFISRLENEVLRLDELISSQDTKTYAPGVINLAKQLHNWDHHLIYAWKALLVREKINSLGKEFGVRADFDVKEETKNLRKREKDLTDERVRASGARRGEINKELLGIKKGLDKYSKLEDLTYKLEGHQKASTTYLNQIRKWPGEPDDVQAFFRDPPEELFEEVIYEPTYQPPKDLDEILSGLHAIPDGKNGPTEKKRLALSVFDSLTPYFRGITAPSSLSLKPDSELKLEDAGALLLVPEVREGRHVIDREGRFLFEQIRPQGEPPTIPSFFLYDALEHLRNVVSGKRATTMENLKDLKNDIVELLSPPEPKILTQEPLDVVVSDEASEFEPEESVNVDNLADDQEMQKEYVRLLNQQKKLKQSIEETLAAQEEHNQIFNQNQIQRGSKESDQWLQEHLSLVEKEKEAQKALSSVEKEARKIADNYPVLNPIELKARLQSDLDNIISQMRDFGLENDISGLLTAGPGADGMSKGTSMTPPVQQMIISNPQQLLPTIDMPDQEFGAGPNQEPVIRRWTGDTPPPAPTSPPLSPEDKKMIQTGNDLIKLLNSRRMLNISSSTNLIPAITSMIDSMEEMYHNYLNAEQELLQRKDRDELIHHEYEEMQKQLNAIQEELLTTQARLAAKEQELNEMQNPTAPPPETDNPNRDMKALKTENSILRTQNKRLFSEKSRFRGEISLLQNRLNQQIAGIPQSPVESAPTETQTSPPPPPPFTAEDYGRVMDERDELKRSMEHLHQQYNDLLARVDNGEMIPDDMLTVAELEAETRGYLEMLQEEQRKNDQLRLELSHAEGQRRVLEGQLNDGAMRDQLELIQNLNTQLGASDQRVRDLENQNRDLKARVGRAGMKNFRERDRNNALREENAALREEVRQLNQDHLHTARQLEETQDQLHRALGNTESNSSINALNEVTALIQTLKYEKHLLERRVAEQTAGGQELKAAHERAVQELVSKHEAELKAREDHHAALNADTVKHYEDRLEAQISSYDQSYGKLKREMEARLNSQVEEYMNEIDGLKAAHEVRLAQMEEDYRAQIDTLKDELAARETSLAALTNPNIDSYYKPYFESARSVLTQFNDLVRDEAAKDLPVVKDVFNVFMGDLKERLKMKRRAELAEHEYHMKAAMRAEENQFAAAKRVFDNNAQENARYQNHLHEESMARLRSDIRLGEKAAARKADRREARARGQAAGELRAMRNQFMFDLIGGLVGSNNPVAMTQGYSLLAEFTKSLLELPNDELNSAAVQQFIKMYDDGALNRLVAVLSAPKQSPVDDTLSRRITDLENTTRSFINMMSQRTAHVGAAQTYHPPRRVFVGREGVPHQGNRYARGSRSPRRLPPRRPDGRFKRASPARKAKK